MATTLDTAFETVRELVRTFEANKHAYLAPDYSEAQARKDFIDKFWIALGWDVNHDQQTNPYEQEVKVERGVAMGRAQRRADYAFYLAPNFHDVRFFVEAKKPCVDIATNENYFQLIRYGWNSDTPLAVLTDFEKLHMLDCRYKPDVEAALNRIYEKFQYIDYTKREKFAEIYWLFSREAIASGSLEKRAKELPKPRGKAVQRGLFPGGYQSIDESFLAELDEHRSDLAHTFKNRNPELDSETLTELAQRTLDRLVFLRFLEDKGIEVKRLVERFGEKGTAWEDFIAASRRLDTIYNGIVYKRHDILDGTQFRVDDDVFAKICESLAPINSPYDFNAIPIHILGSIYERFLGKVIVATDKRAKVKDKPEVRKAGGVYYTPEYIVRYIVENTVGKLIAGKTPNQIADMRFADIACGSGSFLLGVFDLLLNYHGHYYNDHPGKARKGDCVKHDGRLYLSLGKKREILLNNIYGVDIDAQAVEVCQLSLDLKLLQEETEASTRQYLLDFEHMARMKKLLPELSKNIVCGNSLIGRDILEGQLFPSDEERKLNPMDFEDAFPEVMKRGGFDAIVGNPPYSLIMSYAEKDYLRKHFTALHFKINLYACFAERAIRLVKAGGYIGMIVPNLIFANDSLAKLRLLMLQQTTIKELLNCGDGVFKGVSMPTMVFTLQSGATPHSRVRILRTAGADIRNTASIDVDQQRLLRVHNYVFETTKPDVRELLSRLDESFIRLSEVLEVNQGVITGNDEKYLHTRKLNERFKPTVRGKDIERYHTAYPRLFVDYNREELACPRTEDLFDVAEKLLMRRTGDAPVASLDTRRCYNLHTLYSCRNISDLSLKYMLALLNSRLLRFIYQQKLGTEIGRVFAEIKIVYIRQLPIARADNTPHDELVAKVEAMLEAKKELAKAQTDKAKNYYERNCAALDREIDRLVYELYGLTEDEIRIVEHTRE